MSAEPDHGSVRTEVVRGPSRTGPATGRAGLEHGLRSALARATLRATSLVPWNWLPGVGAGLASLAMRVPSRARDSLRVNLELCFPDMDPTARARLARTSLAESLVAMLELGPLWHWKRERVLGLVREVIGQEKLDAAVSSGRGVLLLSLHLGAWEMVGLHVSAQVPLTTLYRPPQVRGLERIYLGARERFGARLVPTDMGGVRALYRALRRGEVVGLLPDQDPGRGAGVFEPFFGVQANTSTLTARLLASTDAVPLLSWAERLEHGRGYRLHFLELDSAALRGPDVSGAARALNLELERLIRTKPEQYLWTYRRFRHRPTGQRHPYARRRGARARAGLAGSTALLEKEEAR